MAVNIGETMVKGPADENAGGGQTSWGQLRLGVIRFCAYNQTRGRFLSTEVECADFSSASLHDRLPALTPGSRIALWINPFRGIGATSVRVPIDLIYLDSNFVVLDTVESFPIFQVGNSSVPAASVLALPAEIIGSTETRPGDRLILCPPEELRRRLMEPAEGNAGGNAQAASSGAQVDRGEGVSSAAGGEIANASEEPQVKRADGASAKAAEEAGAGEAGARQAEWKNPAKKSWLQRLLKEEPPDPRSSPREGLSWITAYFFTGGTPKAHGIRDISAAGVYIFTDERWYPGTVIRMTLTDRRQPSADRSFTVNAEVVRWGNDGVGLRFILSEKKPQRTGKRPGDAESMEEVSRADVEQFLEAVRGGAN